VSSRMLTATPSRRLAKNRSPQRFAADATYRNVIFQIVLTLRMDGGEHGGETVSCPDQSRVALPATNGVSCHRLLDRGITLECMPGGTRAGAIRKTQRPALLDGQKPPRAHDLRPVGAVVITLGTAAARRGTA